MVTMLSDWDTFMFQDAADFLKFQLFCLHLLRSTFFFFFILLFFLLFGSSFRFHFLIIFSIHLLWSGVSKLFSYSLVSRNISHHKGYSKRFIILSSYIHLLIILSKYCTRHCFRRLHSTYLFTPYMIVIHLEIA